jgi:ubiquinone/menaquinone biosynthesis C-methylase UbiE
MPAGRETPASWETKVSAAVRKPVAGRFQLQERQRQLLRLLERHGLLPLAGKQILEVGCGTGKWLRDLIAWGADPESLVGVDLLPASVMRARRLCPQSVTIECSNAASLRFASASFDLVLQAMVFTSVLELEMRRAMAAEMLRVVRPAGIRRLFPGCTLELHRTGQSSGLTQLLAPRSWAACSLPSGVAPLCTHYLGAISPGSIRQCL